MKRWNAIIGLFFCLTISFLWISFAAAQDSEDRGKQILSVPGEILKAYLAAYKDFSKGLAEDSQDPNETAQITSKLENYNVKFFDKDNAYVVQFSLKIKKFPWIRGGGKEYVIDKNTYAILNKIYWR